MSFLVAVYVNEGIVLASDRRSTYTQTENINGLTVQKIGIHVTNSTDKTFICPNGAGISTCGDASILGKPITGFIQDMIHSKIKEETSVKEIPQIIIDYFSNFVMTPNVNFLVAGYAVDEDSTQNQKLYKIVYIMVNNDLGGGSFGKTVLLQDPFIDELFVAKKYEPEFDGIKEQFYKNFLDEIKILYKLNHRNIVRIYNYYAYENIFTGYILMEYIDGKNIGDFIGDYFAPFETTTLDDVFLQLIDAFCYIESHGIIHRDIREGNILIDKSGTVKVIDFGIGKIIAKAEESDTDSLVSEINRAASDTLPQEYYDGVYTNLTDMFYLAELFARLIDTAESCDRTDFSYNDILNKMMEKNPESRFESFAAIREAIGKHDFLHMKISDEDREIYQNFTNLIYESLTSYMAEPRFNTDCAIFMSRLEKALTTNLFETVIQKNADVIGSVVDCGYRYNNRVNIPNETVRKFLDWFRTSTPQSQALVLNNFISKISDIKVIEPEPELPF